MDVTPDIHFWESRRNDRLGWHDCLAELIDNSFDAGATRAELSFSRRSFSIRDDGQGTSDLRSMVRFGGHRKHKTTSLGCYGVGLKDAWAWLSDVISIETVHKGQVISLVSDVKKYQQLESGQWLGPDPIIRVAKANECGTCITFSPLLSNRTAPGMETLEKLGRTFMPAINAGKQIVVNKGKRTPIRAYAIPAMSESIEESFEIAGKLVTIHIGIAQEGERVPRPGFCLCFGHRVITTAPLGCGEFSSSRMVGQIKLGVGWTLTPHKNDLSDHSEELEKQVHARIRHLLEKAATIGEDIESRMLRTEIELAINDAIKTIKGKEKRPGKGDDTGSDEPKPNPKPRKRRKAAVIEEGNGDVSGAASKKKNGIKLDWCEIEAEKLGYSEQLTATVYLNLDNEFIRFARQTKNTVALNAVAVGLFCHSESTSDGKQRFAFPMTDFVGSWGTIMNSLHFEVTQNAND